MTTQAMSRCSQLSRILEALIIVRKRCVHWNEAALTALLLGTNSLTYQPHGVQIYFTILLVKHDQKEIPEVPRSQSPLPSPLAQSPWSSLSSS